MFKTSLFHSKGFLIFNLVTVGVIAGFVIALLTVPFSAHFPFGGTVQAQQVPATYTSASPLVDMPSLHKVAEKVLPSVVEITVLDIVKKPVPATGQSFPFNFFFSPFGGPSNGQGGSQPKSQVFREKGLGSGVIVKRTGDTVYVLTNNHVVGNANQITVKLLDGKQFTAKLVGKDVRQDLALVSFRTTDRNIPIATLGNSNSAQVGDWVIAIGNPYGFQSTVTAGIVSAVGRQGVGPGNTIDQFIQTDAAINPGNSGGALVNMEGQVVGINDWIVAPHGGGSVGLGFAIAINQAKRDITDFIEHGSVQYGWLGVSVQDPYSTLAKQMQLDGKHGSFVAHLFLNSPAAKGGMLPGDFITAINGRKVKNTEDLVRMVGNLAPGQNATFNIIRYGNPMTLNVRIGLRQSSAAIAKNTNLWPGIGVLPLDSQIRKQLKLPGSEHGLVVVNVVSKTSAAIAGLKQGDVIQKINNQPIGNAMDFYQDINEHRTDFSFQIDRQGTIFDIGLHK